MTLPRGVAVLGCTGSIGVSTLRVLARHRERFVVRALVGGANRALLDQQIAEFKPAFAALANATPGNVAERPLVDAATRDDVDIVVNAVVGAAGLDATIAALNAGKRVALANKESLVMAGDLIAAVARSGGGEIVPIDSEHSAILQCLAAQSCPPARVTLTASGGPFRTWSGERMASATIGDALQHPTWRMGTKISVDSATLANKALEVIEAHHLFGLPYDRIDVVVHPQSIVHALVEFADGGVLAQLGFPSMELPILYALTHPERCADQGPARFDPVQAGALTFEPLRHECFPAFHLGVNAGKTGGIMPAAFNAANEIAVQAFVEGRIGFADIAGVIETVLAATPFAEAGSIEAVRSADRDARARATEATS